nr:immunoglobulin light chain junction region [Macaca mulatta]MOX82764.1 immunoglobulin light chain junction region [Macaca mulatta]MOY07126.1 immunoglobulin light chain junction region [Macaca mulatta]MOY09319.1 immunoglobulin light chain junction region [Macaca mulatta]
DYYCVIWHNNGWVF